MSAGKLIRMIALALVSLGAHRISAQVPTVWFVDGGYTGPQGDGESWDAPFTTLEEAIAAADDSIVTPPFNEIWVKANEYHPTNSTTGYSLKANVHVYGGFAGDEEPVEDFQANDPREFDPVTGFLENETILSGEIGSEGFGDNVQVIVTAPDDDDSHIFDGFTVQGARRHAITAIWNPSGEVGSSGTYRNLLIQDNEYDGSTGLGGAGMFIEGPNSRPIIEKCRFVNNAMPAPLSFGGGAILNFQGAATIVDTKFEGNSGAGVYGGGAILFYESQSLVLRRCNFSQNLQTDIFGGAANFERITDFDPETQDLLLIDCTFDDNRVHCVSCNTALQGGAVYDHTGGQYINCAFTNNRIEKQFLDEGDIPFYEIDGEGGAIYVAHGRIIKATNCLFAGNAAAEGGAVYLDVKNEEFPGGATFINCTVAGNVAAGLPFGLGGNTSGGIYIESDGPKLHIVNSILWDNIGGFNGDVVASQVFAGPSFAPTVPDVKYSCVEDSTPGNNPIPLDGTNIDTDPKFVDDTNGNYRLMSDSGCIDSGDNTPLDEDFPTDMLNVDEDGDLDEPIPDLDKSYRFAFGNDLSPATEECSGVVDRGAYEFSVACLDDRYGDLNADNEHNGLDIQPFIDCWLSDPGEQDCICRRGDFVITELLGAITEDDVPAFVNCLLTDDCDSQNCAPPNGGTRGVSEDCNANSIPDEQDIFFCNGDPDLCDCNGNGIPDECDIANGAVDLNENGIPDDPCEPDCNGNDIPDDKDIADMTSDDCDVNGVPDECDIDCDGNEVVDACQTLSVDCNSNNIIDSCEVDCDNDGVPDACELFGNDCNSNGLPDNCDVALPPPLNYPDCNDDDIPDECQLEGNDENENMILDECEQEQLMGGGESMMSSDSSSELTDEEKWQAYLEWCFATDFSEMANSQKFHALLNKRVELGLPAGQQIP